MSKVAMDVQKIKRRVVDTINKSDEELILKLARLLRVKLS